MEVGAKNRLGLPVTAVVMGEDHVEDIEIRTGGCLEGKTEWHEAVLTQIALMEIDGNRALLTGPSAFIAEVVVP